MVNMKRVGVMVVDDWQGGSTMIGLVEAGGGSKEQGAFALPSAPAIDSRAAGGRGLRRSLVVGHCETACSSS